MGILWLNVIEQLKNGQEMTRSKGPQGGIEPEVAAARAQPLYMGRPPYQLRGLKIAQLTDKEMQILVGLKIQNRKSHN